MKKLLTSLLALTLILLPSNSLFATADTSFFEALGNMGTIEDHKAIQSFYGSLEFEEGEDHVSADFRVTFSSSVTDGTRADSFSRVSAFIKFVNHNKVNDSTPFKEMTVQANGEIITRDQDDIYLKLNNFNIGLVEPLPFAVVDIENVMATTDLYRGTWFHATANELAANQYEETFDMEEYIAIEEELQDNPKEAILELSELALYDAEANFTEEEINQFIDGLSILLNAKPFTSRDVVAGRNTGFKFFNLNKGAVLDIIEEIASALGEEMTAEDRLLLRSELGKFSLSGIYRVEPMYDVIDNLLVRFKLRETGPLSHLELNYRFKLRDINKENSVKAPSDFEEVEDVFGSYENDFY